MATSDLAATLLNATLADFAAAAGRIAHDAIRSPLLPYAETGGRTIRLKCENLQPLGSFKIRSGASAVASLDAPGPVVTASAGNFAQGLTLAARRRGLPVTVHAPDSAAGVKLDAVRSLGATVVTHPFDRWWEILATREGGDGTFVHPVAEPAVILGNGSIGLELAADWPELDTVVIPFGGGGLSTGIALALRAMGRDVRIVACEAEGAAPLAAAFAAGQPVTVERRPSFVDGIGSTRVLEEMWPLVARLIDDVIVVPLAEIRATVAALARRAHVVAEGAGAAALAAALTERCGGRHVAVIVSGGNIDPARFCEILAEAG